MTNTIQPGIHKAIASIMKGVDFIKKDRKNTSQGYSFRGIDDMYNALHKLFAESGVFISSDITNTRREERTNSKGTLLIWTIVDACFTFYAEDGTSIKTTMVGEAMDSGDKGCNKAMSAALKYALMQMLLIPTEESKDTESETHEIVAPPAPAGAPAQQLSVATDKPPISLTQFHQAYTRVGMNDDKSADVYHKTIAMFTLTTDQRAQLDKLMLQNDQKKTA